MMMSADAAFRAFEEKFLAESLTLDPTAATKAGEHAHDGKWPDVSVEGESRRGKKEGYDTNLSGRAGQMPSRLMYLGVVGQYRKMMEDAITREQVPRDYHDQIRNYFQALDER